MVARLPAERRTVSDGQPVYLDGSQSEDRDRRPGQLGYTWSCQQAETGAGCFVGPATALKRLETKLGQDNLYGPTLRIPAGLLPAEACVKTDSLDIFLGRIECLKWN